MADSDCRPWRTVTANRPVRSGRPRRSGRSHRRTRTGQIGGMSDTPGDTEHTPDSCTHTHYYYYYYYYY